MKQVVRRFAVRAFSSNLTDDELSSYYQVSLDSLRNEGDFVRAAKLGMKAIVSSHRFLLAPGEHSNDSYRVAADLSRALWLSVPDQRLLELAKGDELSAETIRTESERMLRDYRARRMIHSFCGQWLNLRSFNKVSPSLKLYPKYDDLLNHYLPIETEAYLYHLIDENLPVSYLIDSDFSILNQRLAEHYGIEGVVGQQMRKVSFEQETATRWTSDDGKRPEGHHRWFRHVTHSAWRVDFKEPCRQHAVSSTGSVKAIEPEINNAKTLKEQIEEHKNNETCYACHKSIDPYGFALENFDATGQWRSSYRTKLDHKSTFQYRREGYFNEAGEVDASGEIDSVEFENIFGLKKMLLAAHKKVAYNFAKKFFEYVNGYRPTCSKGCGFMR